MKVTFDFHAPDQKFYEGITLLVGNSHGFINWGVKPLIDLICE